MTTLPPLAGLVRMLDVQAQVSCLLPPGADAHHVRLTPKQVSRLRQAKLLIRSSRDDGNWAGIHLPGRTLDLWPKTDHAWMLPGEVRRMLPVLAARLRRLAPGRKHEIARALDRALRICDQIEKQWDASLAPFRRRGVIMQHPAWLRLCRHVRVPVLAVLEPRHHGGIRPRRLQHALDVLHAHPSASLWADIRHSNQGLIWLSGRQANTGILHLAPLGNCTMSWVQLMRLNLARVTHESSGPDRLTS